jgi:hypothetical protein
VLILFAHGRSSQEIADELVISERTACTHVSRVLRKLQLTSRTQTALATVREGLVPPQTAPPPRIKAVSGTGARLPWPRAVPRRCRLPCGRCRLAPAGGAA